MFALARRPVPPLLHVAALLMADFVSTIAFAMLFGATRNLPLSIGVSLATGLAGIGWTLSRRRRVDAMQWTSLALVVVFGGASLLTGDPRFAMVKPALIYAAVGCAMLRRGWMLRYLPAKALKHGATTAEQFGRIWAFAMFALAATSLVLALEGQVKLWALVATTAAPTLKLGLGALQYVVTRHRVIRAHRAEEAAAAPEGACAA